MLLGLRSFLRPSIPSISRQPISLLPRKNLSFLSFPLQTQSRLLLFSQNNTNKNLTNEPTKQEEQNGSTNNGGDGAGGEDLKKDGIPLFNIKWADLLLDPDPDNILAVGLTGLLTWASVQVLWQLFIISLAILVAALKYSFIAALLLFILITLL